MKNAYIDLEAYASSKSFIINARIKKERGNRIKELQRVNVCRGCS
jgi:hypothetical protein